MQMNIADIAKMAGVSRAAVSRYFNNGYISQEKQEAVRRVVEETGYRPSIQAQNLRTKKTKMIGVIVPKISSSSIGRIVEGMLSEFNKSEYQMILAVTQNDPSKEVEYLSAFDDKQVDGVILVATVFTTAHKHVLKNLSVPVVIVGQYLSGNCCVYHDDYHACYDLTKLLLEKGRINLGYMSALLQDKAAGEARYKGFCDAVCEMGYDALINNIITADFTVASGYKKAKELLQKCHTLDGLVCATDAMALGAMQYFKEHHIAVPEEILVAGHGGSEITRIAIPSLIIARYFYEESGELAVRRLIALLNHEENIIKEVKLGYEIVDLEQ